MFEMCFYDVFAHIQGEFFPARPTSSEIWAWGGGTWGEGLAVLEVLMLGGLDWSAGGSEDWGTGGSEDWRIGG